MKRLLRNIVLATIMLLVLAGSLQNKQAEAATKVQSQAFSWDDVKDGFKDYVNSGTDENGFKNSNFGMDFDYNNPNLKVVGRKNPINLSVRCDPDDDASPLRYWFFFKSNKMRSPNTSHWRTERFTGTTSEITNYNAYQSGKNASDVPRKEVKTGNNTFFKSDGRELSKGGDSYAITLYVVDLKDWFAKAGLDYRNYTCNIFLQSITKIYNAAEKPLTGDLTAKAAWTSAARKYGFAESGIATYAEHYNQWIHLDNSTKQPHQTYIHRIAATKDHPINGDEDEAIDGKTDGTELGKIKSCSLMQFENITTYENNGVKYYLKGIRIVDENIITGEKKNKAHFYILDNPYSKNGVQVTGTKVLTTNYSKKSGSGGKKNTVAGKFNVQNQVSEISSNKKGGFDRESEKISKGGGVYPSEYSNEYLKRS